MFKKIFETIFLITLLFLFQSCGEDTTENEADDSDNPVEVTDGNDESGCYTKYHQNYVSDISGNNSCVYGESQGYRHVHFSVPENHDLSMQVDLKICSMKIEKIESGEIENYSNLYIYESPYYYTSDFQKYTDISGTAVGEKCFEAENYTLRFSGYDRSFFKDSIIGKTINIYASGYYSGGAFIHSVTDNEGRWISLNIMGSGGYSWDSDIRVNSYDIIPQISAVQISDDNCKEICVEEDYGVKVITDYTYQPPVEITVDGEEPVVLRNGESKVVGNYEYFADFSVTVSENDPDGIFTIGGDADPCPSKNGQFYFSVLNLGALK